MRICFLTTPEPDPLQDYLLIGLRQLFGDNCIDHPKKEFLYDSYVLKDIPISRDFVEIELMNGDFDLLIFGSVPRQKGLIKNMVADSLFESFHAQPVFLDSLPTGTVMKETYDLGPSFTNSSTRLALVYLELPPCTSLYPQSSEEFSAVVEMANQFLEEVVLITGLEATN